MTRKHTHATPAGVPRSRSYWTRRERAEIRQNAREIEAQCKAYEALYGDEDDPLYGDEDDPLWRDEEDDYCERCLCRGFVTYCQDDLCQGDGGCIHGDNVACPECGGRWL